MTKFNVFFLGFLTGTVLSILYAPKKGSKTREILSKPSTGIDEVRQYIKDYSPTSNLTESRQSPKN
ncbi:MAG: YtxH domain-containing protein [Bacteroidetes bacterium]|nr:YtxH domain-containing protein [Bacteroidota bacterium]